jgi:hypothetical protein
MPIKFNASVVSATEEDWGTLIIFSVDETLEAERYLMIQRAREFSNEAVRLGMNDVYIETCGQGWSWYGHIVTVELLKGMIKIQLDAEAAARLEDNGLLEVTFEVPEDEFKHLRASLRRAFVGRTYYSEAAA